MAAKRSHIVCPTFGLWTSLDLSSLGLLDREEKKIQENALKKGSNFRA